LVNVFFSYSHRDQDLRDELETHLSSLKRQGLISAWHDKRIVAGSELDLEISRNFEQADIILLLVSAYFIDSENCYGVELERAMQKNAEGSARVIPIILRPCDWHILSFGKLLAIPKDGKPITKFSDHHEAFAEVGLAVRKAVESLGKSRGDAAEGKPMQKAKPSPVNSTPVTSKSRSSNLRVKKEFTEREKDVFLQDAIEYFSNFFEASLMELEKRNKDIETNFRKMDANTFTAVIYRSGKNISTCKIWLSNRSGFGSGIAYSSDDSSRGNSMNEILSMAEGDNRLALNSTMSFGRGSSDELTMEGGSEYYWARLIEPLQGRE
jgi:hypothetical protein